MVLGPQSDRPARLGLRPSVVTGIPLEFQFGTNWARFSEAAGGVIGQTLAMEGHFNTEEGVGLVLIGQPNMETLALDNPIVVPKVLSFMTHQPWEARIVGLTEFEPELWPDEVSPSRKPLPRPTGFRWRCIGGCPGCCSRSPISRSTTKTFRSSCRSRIPMCTESNWGFLRSGEGRRR